MPNRVSVWLFCILCSIHSWAQEPVDRVMAVVDEDPILASDLEQIIGLGLLPPAQGEGEEAYRRRILDLLIDQKLRFHEVDQFGFTQIPVDEVERQLANIRDRFESPAAFNARLEELGLDEQGLRQVLARQIMVLIYVEERLGARVFVGLDEIQSYYDEVFVPELKAQGASVPPVEEVREELRQVLREERLNEEIERWTEELRQEADVVDHFDSRRGELPPLVISSEP